MPPVRVRVVRLPYVGIAIQAQPGLLLVGDAAIEIITKHLFGTIAHPRTDPELVYDLFPSHVDLSLIHI